MVWLKRWEVRRLCGPPAPCCLDIENTARCWSTEQGDRRYHTPIIQAPMLTVTLSPRSTSPPSDPIDGLSDASRREVLDSGRLIRYAAPRDTAGMVLMQHASDPTRRELAFVGIDAETGDRLVHTRKGYLRFSPNRWAEKVEPLCRGVKPHAAITHAVVSAWDGGDSTDVVRALQWADETTAGEIREVLT